MFTSRTGQESKPTEVNLKQNDNFTINISRYVKLCTCLLVSIEAAELSFRLTAAVSEIRRFKRHGTGKRS